MILISIAALLVMALGLCHRIEKLEDKVRNLETKS